MAGAGLAGIASGELRVLLLRGLQVQALAALSGLALKRSTLSSASVLRHVYSILAMIMLFGSMWPFKCLEMRGRDPGWSNAVPHFPASEVP